MSGSRLSRTEAAMVAEYRALVPVTRRRTHTVLLCREEGTPPRTRAIVRVDDAAALGPLVERLREGQPGAELRVAETEDGVQDDLALWARGVSLDRFLAMHERRGAHAV